MLNNLIALIAQSSPPILFFGSILGFIGWINLGPKELPTNDPYNRQLSYPIFILSIGLFLYVYTNLIEIGLGIGLVGFFLYIFVMKKVRDVYPRTYVIYPFAKKKEAEKQTIELTNNIKDK